MKAFSQKQTSKINFLKFGRGRRLRIPNFVYLKIERPDTQITKRDFNLTTVLSKTVKPTCNLVRCNKLNALVFEELVALHGHEVACEW